MVLLILVACLLDSGLRLPRFSLVLPSGSPSLGGTSAGSTAKVPKVLPSGSPSLGVTFAGSSAKVPKVLPSGSPFLGGTS